MKKLATFWMGFIAFGAGIIGNWLIETVVLHKTTEPNTGLLIFGAVTLLFGVFLLFIRTKNKRGWSK